MKMRRKKMQEKLIRQDLLNSRIYTTPESTDNSLWWMLLVFFIFGGPDRNRAFALTKENQDKDGNDL